jgi:endonuclease G, mitochondrial
MQQFTSRLAMGWLTCLLIALPIHAQDVNRNIRFGMPKHAAGVFKDSKFENHVITRDQYVLSYNGKLHTPNWVSWQLVKSDIGNTARGAFKQDSDLPKGFTQITSNVYNACGFDRGHMCPSKDRSDSAANNDATFLMTNVVPQAPDNNQKPWEQLETYCRDLAKHGDELYIVCGPHGTGGEGKNGAADTIGKGKNHVNVPASTWKVIMVLPKGTEPSKRTRMIAVVVPNKQDVDENWSKYRVSVNRVEELTGFTFYPDLPKAVADAIKEPVDRVPITIKKRK